MLLKKDSLCTTLFRHELATSMLSNNSNRLTSRRQQGSSMLVVIGEVSKHLTATSADPTGLSRWNYVDVVKKNNKVIFISTCQCVKV